MQNHFNLLLRWHHYHYVRKSCRWRYKWLVMFLNWRFYTRITHSHQKIQVCLAATLKRKETKFTLESVKMSENDNVNGIGKWLAKNLQPKKLQSMCLTEVHNRKTNLHFVIRSGELFSRDTINKILEFYHPLNKGGKGGRNHIPRIQITGNLNIYFLQTHFY